jgi:flavin reductase (DIM6/NTAB) family NADH-FMN oxidoreductase RutF
MSAAKSFDSVLGRVPSGIYILTIGAGERASGMLVSWVMQAGFEPPMISVAIRQGRYIGDWIAAGQPFVINTLGEDQSALKKHFSSGFEPGEPAFKGLSISHCPRGVPILDEALGHMECEPVRHVDSGDHRVFLANVVRGKLKTSSGQPMVHVRKSGAKY